MWCCEPEGGIIPNCGTISARGSKTTFRACGRLVSSTIGCTAGESVGFGGCDHLRSRRGKHWNDRFWRSVFAENRRQWFSSKNDERRAGFRTGRKKFAKS